MRRAHSAAGPRSQEREEAPAGGDPKDHPRQLTMRVQRIALRAASLRIRRSISGSCLQFPPSRHFRRDHSAVHPRPDSPSVSTLSVEAIPPATNRHVP
jgi:hypothetical protein